MKNQSRIAITAGLIALGLANAWAVVPPAQPSLPNIDKRTALTAAAQPNAVAQQAETALRARVPDLLLSRDRLLGTPRWVSASHGFLSGPGGAGKALAASPGFASPNNPQVPIRNFLNEHAALFGHDATVLDAARITRDFTTAHNGLHTVIWEQMVDEVPVFEGLLIGHVTKNGELVSLSSRFVPDAVGAADAGTPGRQALIVSPTITAAQAVVNGAANLGVTVDVASVAAAGPAAGPQKRQKLKAVGLAGDAKVWLVWLPLNKDSMRLCWQVLLTSRARGELYSVLVDAETGDVLVRRCLTN